MVERGELEILVSTMATIEVAYLDGLDDQVSEAMIRELFDWAYIIPVAIDVQVASTARELIRKYRAGPKIKPPDAHIWRRLSNGRYPWLRRRIRTCCDLMDSRGTRMVTGGFPSWKGPFECPAFDGRRC